MANKDKKDKSDDQLNKIKERRVKLETIAHSICMLQPPKFTSMLQLSVGTYVHRKTGSKLIVELLSNIVVRKFKQKLKSVDLANKNQIILQSLKPSLKNPFENVQFEDLNSMSIQKVSSFPVTYGAYVWAKNEKLHIGSWKGFFEKIYSDQNFYSTSLVHYLPFINAAPTDLTTINTALYFAKNETRKINQKTTFTSFDQPLYHKARALVSQDDGLDDVVIVLGEFHLRMSYMGCVGYIMDGSGLAELWATVYAKDSVKAMLTGKAYARALRAHILTFTALGKMICERIDVQHADLSHIKNLFSKLNTNTDDCDMFSENITVGDLNADPVIKRLTNLFNNELEKVEQIGNTAKLWVQYFKIILVLLQSIEAERVGDWNLKLSSLKAMLPIFHAAGRYAYAKSGQVYLQDMYNLQFKMDHEEFVKYTNEGYFTVHRSDKP